MSIQKEKFGCFFVGKDSFLYDICTWCEPQKMWGMLSYHQDPKRLFNVKMKGCTWLSLLWCTPPEVRHETWKWWFWTSESHLRPASCQFFTERYLFILEGFYLWFTGWKTNKVWVLWMNGWNNDCKWWVAVGFVLPSIRPTGVNVSRVFWVVLILWLREMGQGWIRMNLVVRWPPPSRWFSQFP